MNGRYKIGDYVKIKKDLRKIDKALHIEKVMVPKGMKDTEGKTAKIISIRDEGIKFQLDTGFIYHIKMLNEILDKNGNYLLELD